MSNLIGVRSARCSRRRSAQSPRFAQNQRSDRLQVEVNPFGFRLNAHNLLPCLALRRIRPQGLKTASRKATVRAVGDTIGG
jgi:hypothetical protein